MMRMIAAVRTAIGVLMLTVGVPLVLAAVAGSPIPHSMPTLDQLRAWLDEPLQPEYAAGTARTIAWGLWAALTAAVVAVLTATAAGRISKLNARRLAVYLPRPIQGLTATVLGAAAVTTAAPAVHPPAPITATDTTPPDATHLISLTNVSSHPRVTLASAITPTSGAAATGRETYAKHPTLISADRENTCTVARGDTLSAIAEQWLGDADRWPEIFTLNRGTHYPNVGGTLTDPDLIYPGWTLHLPDDATPPHHGPKPPPEHPNPDPTPPLAPGSPPTTPSTTATGVTASAPSTAPSSPATATPHETGTATTPSGGKGDRSTAAPGSAPDRSIPPAAAPTAERSAPRGIALPSGAWIDLGLALAVAAAVALVWAHRRRRYTPRPPQAVASTNDPDLAPMPPIVTAIRRSLLRSRPGASADVADPDLPILDPDDDGAGHDLGGTDAGSATGRDACDDAEPGDSTAANADRAPAPLPVVPALAHALAAVWPPAGVGLVGPGAAAAARGFLIAGLAGGPDDPDARTWVVMPSAIAATLLGTDAVTMPDTPRLSVTADLDDALGLLEAHTLHRTRLVYHHETDTITALRAENPAEAPLPPIMLIAEPAGRHERTRVAALLAQGQRLDIHGVLLGDWPDGNTIQVAADGTTTPADGDATRHSAHPADIGRLTMIDPAEAADLITTLSESHTGHPPAPAFTERHPVMASRDISADDGTVDAIHPATANTDAPSGGEQDPNHDHADHAEPVEPAATSKPLGPDTAEPEPSPRTSAHHAGTASPLPGGEPAIVDDHTADNEEPDTTPPGSVEVTVLGRAEIVDADPQRAPRPKSLELLVYLAAHDGSATVDAILEDLLPDAPKSRAGHRLHTYVSDLRGVLCLNGGHGEYVTHPRLHYRLNPATVGIDLWQMRAAIADATRADQPSERIAALRRAVTLYRGPLAADHDYLWIEPYREATRRQALDATTALIDALADQPDEQLTVLGPAIDLHPYAEHLYQAAMRAHHHLGHLDDIRALRRAVTTAAAELDAEPSDDTLALADRLVTDLQTRRRPVALQSRPGGAA